MMRTHSPVPDDSNLAADLNHQINSPLAAIRNALYLAARRSSDSEIRRYLRLADDEVAAIAAILRAAARVESAAGRSALTRAAAAGNRRAVV